MIFLYSALSLIFCAFAQPAWIPQFGMIAASFGYALFWRALLLIPERKKRAFVSLVWFASVQGIQLSWLGTLDYMGPLILLLYLFLITAMGVQFSLMSLFVKRDMSYRTCFSMASLWAVFEWLRLFFLCGFTWNPVGLSLTGHELSLQFASIFGIFGLSFWVIFTNSIALKAWVGQKRSSFAAFALAAFLPYGYGAFQTNFIDTDQKNERVSVALLQTALFPEQKEPLLEHPDAFIPATFQWKRIIDLIDEKKRVEWIILPEAALPFGAHYPKYTLEEVKKILPEEFFPPLKIPYAIWLDDQWKVTNVFIAQTIANQHSAHLITGLDDRDFFGKYNAAFHFRPSNQPYERYEKQVLVPIGEYMPLMQSPKISQFICRQFGIYSSFDAGKKSKIFEANHPIGINICLEETFSNLTRRLRQMGAKVFVNLTNDVWFPRSKLPEQHFDHGRVRAVENGVPILRACNTGVTGGVDCFGNLVGALEVSEEEPAILYLDLPLQNFKTLYTFWGDAGILFLSVFLLLVDGALAIFLKKYKAFRPLSILRALILKKKLP